jgi:TetR/AcrR family transcriptional repressor of nem operon
MKVSKEIRARHREQLIEAASRLLRERGFEVGVAEIAAAAGLTHGAFYAHFGSKEALCVEAIAQMTRHSSELAKSSESWDSYIEAYLSPRHARNRGGGCPYAALSGDVPREAASIKAAFSRALENSLESAASRMDDSNRASSRERAIVATATMVGAVVLARAVASEDLREEILDTVKRKLLNKRPR